MLIEMTIKGLVVDSFSSTPIVILKDKAGVLENESTTSAARSIAWW